MPFPLSSTLGFFPLSALPRLLGIVCLAAWLCPVARASNPLGLTPGTAATVTLGQITTLANFNTSTAAADISYTNSDLATRSYVVRLPTGYNASDPAKTYGLVTYIDAGDAHTFPASYAAALDARNVIWIGGIGIGNAQFTDLRRGVAIMGAYRLSQLYPIDPARIYVSGLSGGSRTANDLAYLRSDYFRGFIGRVGSSLPAIIPGWQTAGSNSNVNNFDADYEYMSVNSADPSVVLPAYFRTVLMTQYGDFRRSEQLAVYRYGHLNHGNQVRLVMRPGGHSDEVGPSFTDALDFLYHPLVDLVWDRFQNSDLSTNPPSGGDTVAGTGFTSLSGTVSETTYSYNSTTHGVLRLNGDGAAVRANDTFTWKDPSGILLDARLRAETATGLNQQIGLHILPANAPETTPATQTGFHLYWVYGQPDRAELVTVDGTRKTLATWEHTATHPMNLATTVTSPQSGEGVVTEKTFWHNNNSAPAFAGRTQAFRGEDVRLVLNSVGFQLTFNRPAVNLTTAYTGKVVTATTDAVTTNPNETFPIVLQGFWSEVETAAINALPAGSYKLLLTNDAITPGQPVGNALVDELHLIASSSPTALQNWRALNFGTTSSTGTAADLADPDGDGLPNLLEYALASNPNAPASANAPTASLLPAPGSTLVLSFLRARSGLTYTVEASSTLAPDSWTVIATNPGTVSPTVPVTVTDSVAPAPSRFLRLRVTAP